MQQSDWIEEYLEKAVPKMVSAKKHKHIRDELMSHILDKVDFYIEIGYSENDAYMKAIKEMGEPEDTSTQFEEVYREKKIYSRIAFAVIICADLFAAVTGIGASIVSIYFKELLWLTYESLILSNIFLFCVAVTILYAYKEKHPSMLRAVGFAHLLMTVPFVSGSVYYPAGVRIVEFISSELSTEPQKMAFIPTAISLTVFLVCIVLASRVKKKENRPALSGKGFCFGIVSFLCISVLSCSNITLVESMNAPNFCDSELVGIIESRNSIKELDRLYATINEKSTFEEADRILREAGYIPHTELHTVIKDEEELNYILLAIEEIYGVDTDKETVYVKNDRYASIYSDASFIIPHSEEVSLNYKKMYYGTHKSQLDISFYIEYFLFNVNLVEKAADDFEKLHIGYNEESTLETVKKTCKIQSVMTIYTEKDEIRTYTFKADESDFDNHYYFEGTLSFDNNGKLITGSYQRYYYDTHDADRDEVYIEGTEEYTITQ